MGTLACLATGFETIARHPTLIVIPTLLDLFLWLGPRLSMAPVFKSMEQAMMELLTFEGIGTEVGEASIFLRQILNSLATEFNLFTVLTPAPLLGVPSLMAAEMPLLGPFGARAEVEISSFLFIVAWSIILIVMGLFLSALYLRMIGIQVIEETEAPLPGPDSTIAVWGQLIKLVLILIAVLFGISLLSSIFVSCVGMVSLRIAAFLMTLFSSLGLFVALHMLFAVPAIVLLRRPLFQAVRESFILTRSDFLNVTALILLILVISQGFTFVWSLPDHESWAALIGIGGHAFVSSALVATLFIFFQERLRFLEAIEKAFAAKETPAQSAVGK